MVTRTENGKLSFKSLDAEIFAGDLLEKCENAHEIEWVAEQMIETLKLCAQERASELGVEVEVE